MEGEEEVEVAGPGEGDVGVGLEDVGAGQIEGEPGGQEEDRQLVVVMG